ncbi:MAG: tripartite tricarboxylate transporter substrate binding protein [Rhizobacter sp.]
MTTRTRSRRHLLLVALAAAAAAATVPPAHAQSWPARPIRIVVPYPPGGFTDVTARLIAQKLQERLGQTVTVDNRPGANGIIGTDAVAKAAPDGYTFGVVIAAYAANTTLYAKLPYDPQKDLAPVSLIGLSPLVAAVNQNAPFKTAKELVEHARRNPGKLSFASSGNGSAAHLTTELLEARTGAYMVHIPYRGAAAALTDLMGGQVELFFDAASGLLAPGKAGKVRLIGVASDKRLPAAPDVPTFIEQGITGFTGSTWAGMLAPAGTPRDVVKRVADEIGQIVRQDDVRARLEGMGTVPVGNSPEEFERFIADETRKWGDVIRRAKVTLD